MTSQLGALMIVVASTVCYHVAQRSIPAQIRPSELFAFVYALAALAMLAVTLGSEPYDKPLRQIAASSAHWAPWLLAAAVIGIELGVLAMYRSGWSLATGNVTAQALVVVTLAVVGAAVFGEQLTWGQGLGVVFCVTGAWMIAR